MSPRGEKGAGGRPPKDKSTQQQREKLSTTVHPSTLIEIDTRAEASNKSRGEVIDDAFKPKEGQ